MYNKLKPERIVPYNTSWVKYLFYKTNEQSLTFQNLIKEVIQYITLFDITFEAALRKTPRRFGSLKTCSSAANQPY